jgi:hypothetical protein
MGVQNVHFISAAGNPHLMTPFDAPGVLPSPFSPRSWAIVVPRLPVRKTKSPGAMPGLSVSLHQEEISIWQPPARPS